MSDTPRGERLQIMLTQEELEALDTWRFARRMPSRAAAVRELLKRGLADETANPDKRKSQDFGVIGDAHDQHAAEDGHAPHGLDGNGAGRGESADGHG